MMNDIDTDTCVPCTDDLILVGRVTRPHAVRGEVRVLPYSGDPKQMLQYSRVLLAAADQGATPVLYKVERARMQKNSVVLQLEGCSSRDGAEQLVRSSVYVYPEDLPEPAENEFYLREFEGKILRTAEGQMVGKIIGFLADSPQTVLQVQGERQEYLIPLAPAFLRNIDHREVTVALPSGLLEINS
jgi:16S rRNA processing protein RimM